MTALSLEQAPPLHVPLRFFVTGPLLGACAGILLALEPAATVASRWSPTALGAVHLLTLGLLGQVMLGALWQFMPVAAGANVPRPTLTGGATHVGLLAGTLVLVTGFVTSSRGGLLWGGVILAVTLGLAGLLLSVGLWRSAALGPTRRGLQWAVVGLLATTALGGVLAVSLGTGAWQGLGELTAAHAGVGVAGWGLMLVASVAWLVVPMFQLTPPYPLWFCRAFLWSTVGAVTVWGVANLLHHTLLALGAALLISVATLGLAAMTLSLQARRRRRISDATLWHWRVSMVLLALAAPLALLLVAGLLPGETARWEWVVAVSMLAGVFPGLITGMLFKIVPFLVWLHLKDVMLAPPTMTQIIPAPHMRVCGGLLAVAVVVLLPAPWWPPLARVGGLLFAAAMVWLEVLLLRALRDFRRHRARATTTAPSAPASPP